MRRASFTGSPALRRRGVVSSCGLAAAWLGAVAPIAHAAPPDPFASLPSQISLRGVVRDFKASGGPGGHFDFQRMPTAGGGHYVGMVENTLDVEGKPTLATTGYKVTTEWRDASGQNIIPTKPYLAPMPGDLPGLTSATQGGALSTAARFDQWFRDVPGVNLAAVTELTLNRTPGTCEYVFDDKLDPVYKVRGGFFPINGQLYGNYSNTKKNFHFTFEMESTFRYKKGAGQAFTFMGDDDVWVFVDNKLVIDCGGVHTALEQTIDMDRLTWLKDEQVYTFKFFFTERHTSQSNFRIETSLNLLTVAPPEITAIFD